MRTISICTLLSLTLGLHVGSGTETISPPHSSPDWCAWMQSKPGMLYKNSDNPILQSFHIGARLHYQAAHIDGSDVNGRDYHTSHDEYRRARIETKVQFLQYFSANIKLNMVHDERRIDGNLDWGYENFDEAVFSFDIKKTFAAVPLDALNLNYGRQKFIMTEEIRISSKEISTIERSATANKLYGANTRPTGVTLDATHGDWSGTIGLFSGEDDSDFIGGWNDGQAYYASLEHQTTDEWRFVIDSVVNDPSSTDDFLGYDWGAALNAIYEKDRFGAITTVVFGENNAPGTQGGSFHGFMVMPYYWILENRMQTVIQYQYAGAEKSEGIRTGIRYISSANPHGVNINNGRGDELHTVYTGLNYLFCGHNLKVMTGIEYTRLSTPIGDMDALTYLIGFRTFF